MPTQTGTLKAGSQIVIDSIGSPVDYDVSVTGHAVDFKRIQQKNTLSLGPYKVDCSYSITINSGYPSIYKVQPNGQREYTSGALPDPASLSVGASGIVGSNVIRVTDGIWQSQRRTVYVKTGLESDSAFNTLQIQTALNLGGIVEIVGNPGKVYVDKSVNAVACLVHPSFTTLVIPDDIRITQAANQKVPLIVSKSVADHINGLAKVVTLSWVSGSSFTVTSVAHGKAVGDYVSIYKTSVLNTDPIQFAGTFMVRSVIDANSFTCDLYRSGVGAPTNTTQWTMLDSTVSAKLHGGKWDYNGAVNAPTGGTLQNMCSIYAFTALCELNPGTFYNTKKYCVMAGCDYGSYIARCDGDASTGSDGVKVYGPAVGTRVGKITGAFHDDCFSSQSYEAEAYAGYRVCWGDVLNVHIEEINATSTTAGAVVYTSAVGLGHTDNVTFGKICSNHKVGLIGLASKVGDVGFVDFGVISSKPFKTSGAFQLQTSNCNAGYVKATIVVDTMNPTPGSASISSTTHIDTLDVTLLGGSKTVFPAGAYLLMPVAGEIDKLILKGGVKGSQGNMRVVDLPSAVDGYVKHIEIDMSVESAAWVCRFNAGTQTYTPVVDIKGDYSAMDSVFNSANTANVARVRVGDVSANSIPGGVVRAAAGVTVMSGSSGLPYLTGGSVLNVPNGGTISAWS